MRGTYLVAAVYLRQGLPPSFFLLGALCNNQLHRRLQPPAGRGVCVHSREGANKTDDGWVGHERLFLPRSGLVPLTSGSCSQSRAHLRCLLYVHAINVSTVFSPHTCCTCCTVVRKRSFLPQRCGRDRGKARLPEHKSSTGHMYLVTEYMAASSPVPLARSQADRARTYRPCRDTVGSEVIDQRALTAPTSVSLSHEDELETSRVDDLLTAHCCPPATLQGPATSTTSHTALRIVRFHSLHPAIQPSPAPPYRPCSAALGKHGRAAGTLSQRTKDKRDTAVLQ